LIPFPYGFWYGKFIQVISSSYIVMKDRFIPSAWRDDNTNEERIMGVK